MDSDQGKLFIGGISWETSEEKLKEYFGGYGDVLQAVVMRDKITGKPRGFGFVVFSDPIVLDRVLQDRHVIDGRTVEAKRALSREEQQVTKPGNPTPGRSFGGSGGGGGTRTKKIFVGGLPAALTDDAFRQYFESYGNVTDVVIMFDQQTNRPRGFGFISFDSEDAVDRVLHKTFHDLQGKQVEVKRAMPKDSNPGGGSGRSMGVGGGAGGYQSYGGSGGNSGSYDNRMDSGRYMQSQSNGGYGPYGSSGYGAAGYGYGPSSNGMGYGSYGGYGGPAASGYGNPNGPSAGYGPQGAARSAWGSQGSSGYGSVGYGSTGGGGAAAAGHSPGGAAGYGSQGYGYGGYGSNDGSYGNPAGYGAVGGRSGSTPTGNGSGDLQAGVAGYIGGGYGDASGNSGYGSSGWRSDPSQASGNYGSQSNGPHGGQAGYGGYGSRQVQQQ